VRRPRRTKKEDYSTLWRDEDVTPTQIAL